MNRLTIPAFVLSGFVLGLAVAWLVHGLHAAPSLQPLLAERDKLQADFIGRRAAPAVLPLHRQWQKLQNYTALYRQLSLTAVDEGASSTNEANENPRPQWRGELSGPVRELILVSRSLQTIAAVRFERLSVEQGQARLFFSLAGGADEPEIFQGGSI